MIVAIICGCPGSGKSSLSRGMKERLFAQSNPCQIFSYDSFQPDKGVYDRLIN